ncbi:TPA: SpoIID/LytB domain-containing protein [Candidatus Scatousia excrementigallinarum]|uniref:SpoIID/LytB domain-containing protein n=1 Tax=Candidatus Scatousia excrementigallinarum TaxID=2840935 RepID=A0A9D1JM31_9BACT|nr:SpoIID/LytB domain-containing protein [Candidatus Scatousia excrementigallinarum]
MRKISLVYLIFIFMLFVQNPANAIKIGLQTGVDRIGVGSSNATSLIDANTNKTIVKIDAMKGYEIVPYRNTMAIRLDGKFYQIYSDNIVLKPSTGGFISAKSKWYRGHLIIQNKNKKLTVINEVDLEDYIKGVVPSEMPSSWELEALKAQAIAARSYALANLGKRASLGYDLKDTPEDQAYGGASAETSKTNKAVDETSGLVLTYNYKVVSAFYSASAGGQTVTAKEAWGNDVPYVRSVPSFDENVKKNGHGIGMSQHGANNLAKQGYNAYQILNYFYKNVKFARANGSSIN